MENPQNPEKQFKEYSTRSPYNLNVKYGELLNTPFFRNN